MHIIYIYIQCSMDIPYHQIASPEFSAIAVVAWVCWKNWTQCCAGAFATSSGNDGDWCFVWRCRIVLEILLPNWHCWIMLPGGRVAWCDLAWQSTIKDQGWFIHVLSDDFKHHALSTFMSTACIFCPQFLWFEVSASHLRSEIRWGQAIPNTLGIQLFQNWRKDQNDL